MSKNAYILAGSAAVVAVALVIATSHLEKKPVEPLTPTEQPAAVPDQQAAADAQQGQPVDPNAAPDQQVPADALQPGAPEGGQPQGDQPPAPPAEGSAMPLPVDGAPVPLPPPGVQGNAPEAVAPGGAPVPPQFVAHPDAAAPAVASVAPVAPVPAPAAVVPVTAAVVPVTTEIAPLALREMIQKKEIFFVLDVRQPEEFAQDHLDNATLIPLGELASRLAEVPQDKKVVVYCRSGARSSQAVSMLKDHGYKDVVSLAGGLTAFRAVP